MKRSGFPVYPLMLFVAAFYMTGFAYVYEARGRSSVALLAVVGAFAYLTLLVGEARRS